MIYGLAESSSSGGFGSAKVLIPLVAGIVLLLTPSCGTRCATEDPLIDLRLFKNRTFATSSMSLMLMCISVFGAFLLLPLYFQAVRGESPLMAGVLLAPQGLGSMITMPIAGQLSDKIGSGRIVPFGLITVLASVIWLTQIGAHTSWARDLHRPVRVRPRDGLRDDADLHRRDAVGHRPRRPRARRPR